MGYVIQLYLFSSFLVTNTMVSKKVILVQISAVGMKHYGIEELDVGGHYEVQKETDVHGGLSIRRLVKTGSSASSVQAYILHKQAKTLITLFNEGLVSKMVLKPKDHPKKPSRYQGPRQSCSLGFYAKEGAIPRIRAVLSPLYCHYKISDR